MVMLPKKSSRFRTGIAAGVLPLMLAVSCGIFSPRSSEPPIAPGRTDPLSIKSIMTGSGEQFIRSQYEDLFGDACIYQDLNSGVSNKGLLIQRLNYITQQYENISVHWRSNPGGIWKNTANDTMRFSGITYAVRYSGNLSQPPDDSGVSDFTLAKNIDWRIVQWQDVAEGGSKSFFSP